MTEHLLSIENLSFFYPGTAVPALKNISFSVAAGECISLTGHSGCGKSTLLLAIKGLLPGGRKTGKIDVRNFPDDSEWSISVGIVFQNVESQNFCSTVAEEVAFGPENLCIEPEEIARRVESALRNVGLENCTERNIERFSAGQKQRLAIAAVLSLHPSILLLDEPTSQLDRQGKVRLAELLGDLKQQGYTLIISEHNPQPFETIIDRTITLKSGKIVEDIQGTPHIGTRLLSPVTRRRNDSNAPIIATVQDVCCSYPETGIALQNVNLAIRSRELLFLLGENGAGKSTLLRCLAGLEQPEQGTVHLKNIGSPRPERLAGKVGVMFQNPVRQLFAESVREEVAFSLLRLKYTSQETEQLVDEALTLCNISHLAQRAPLTLSFGEQHRVALAATLAPRPGLLLLDEPFAGLDIPQRQELLLLLGELSKRHGTSILIASHDEPSDHDWADRSLLLERGVLIEISR